METDQETMSCGKRIKYLCQFHYKGMTLVLAPLMLAPLLTMEPKLELHCCFVAGLMAIYWVTEAMPLPITALAPIVLFPLMEIMTSKQVTMTYFRDGVIMFMGSLIVTLAIENSKLHKRIAMCTIKLVGCSPRRLHFSLMIVTMFMSIWLSNAGVTAMMCPIVKGVLDELTAQGMAETLDTSRTVPDNEPPHPSRIAIAFYLGIAYASSIGGVGSLVGTATNLAFKNHYDTRFPNQREMDFANFIYFNIPHIFVHTTVVCIVLQWHLMGLFRPNSREHAMVNAGKESIAAATSMIDGKFKELGRLTCHEVQVALLVITMVVLCFTRKPDFFTGWADFMNMMPIKPSAPVMFVVFMLFVLPVNYVFMKYFICSSPAEKGPIPSLVTWKLVNRDYPWGLIFLIGGGLALAEGIHRSGFAALAGKEISSLGTLPGPLVQLLLILIAHFATAFTTNVSMCNILAPIILEMAVANERHPAYFGLPVCLALSMAFHLPVSTPPNAIVAGFANIRTCDMAVAGIGATITTVVGLFLLFQTWAYVVWPGIGEFPDYAKPPEEGGGTF